MIPLSKIITEFENRYFDKYDQSILPSHRNALHAMKGCRSEAGPHMLVQCSDPECQEYSFIPHSCGHRNCPHCQSHEGQQWIDNQLSKQLPAEYYLITFTLPSQLRDLAWQNQKLVYTLFFFCVQDVLKTFTENDKKLNGEAGFTAILHTHSRELNFHPHIHVVIPENSGLEYKNRETELEKIVESRMWEFNNPEYLDAKNEIEQLEYLIERLKIEKLEPFRKLVRKQVEAESTVLNPAYP